MKWTSVERNHEDRKCSYKPQESIIHQVIHVEVREPSRATSARKHEKIKAVNVIGFANRFVIAVQGDVVANVGGMRGPSSSKFRPWWRWEWSTSEWRLRILSVGRRWLWAAFITCRIENSWTLQWTRMIPSRKINKNLIICKAIRFGKNYGKETPALSLWSNVKLERKNQW